MKNLFDIVSQQCSKTITEQYSTSFSGAIKLLHKDLRQPIHNIYAFVRFADEIVDSFHTFNKAELLQQFQQETYASIQNKISLNPILNSFQLTVNKYQINPHLIDAFFQSMTFDLERKNYDTQGYQEYIYGSAEVVGLMCLHIFLENDNSNYEVLTPFAKSLGAAFQKINFLRDINADYNILNRIYFPNCDFNNFSKEQKHLIENEIQHDFDIAYQGILQLPIKARFGVYVAYKYYLSLFKKIKNTEPKFILQKRVRIPNYRKAAILAMAGLRRQFNIL